MIGIISAMQDELAALLTIVTDQKKLVLGQRTYYQGKLNKQEVVLVFSNWGKVAAAITTTQLIAHFNPKEIIFTGVAGAIDPTLAIGDLVLANSLVQHDMDASPLFKKHEIPLIGKSSFTPPKNKLLQDCIAAFQASYFTHISKEEAKEFNIKLPTVVMGLIASGDQFISDVQTQNQLKNQLPNLSCVEMEGAAVAQVCEAYETPYQVIRIISDKANDNAPIDFPKFTQKIASKYAKGILEKYCN
ncbi:5'-methylthioadenosine/adenosylhomocysteine nucleosidase [Ochrovirga pacifica]|uniref:5'-methylthioadenosine/adenosylhomocysteine nucleosidase n=1 Tax=Ochrovirga pacifica TaxID=1042376 RepID=UPI00025591DF|nr:5'-methylthioadenosine/adenosylhomocysteine nucleosidase [Ochrovirga pacifica]